jgi:replicative DNA helicase
VNASSTKRNAKVNTPDPLPPHDNDAERAVLGSLLLAGDPDYVRRARTIICAEDFYGGKGRVTFEAMCALAEAGTPLDTVTMGGWLDANRPGQVTTAELSQLVLDTPTYTNMAHYARLVFDTSTRRKLIEAMSSGVRGAYELPGGEALSYAQNLLTDLHATQAKGEASDMRSVADIALAGRGRTWTWGISDLDEWTNGGLCHGDFHVIDGYTSTGKTHFGVSIAWAAACAGARVGYFSLEVGKRDLFWRLAGHVSGIDWRLLMASKAADSVRAEPRQRAVDTLTGMDNLWLFDRQRTVDQITMQAVANNLDVAIVDYGQLVAASEKGHGMYEQNASAAMKLQGLAKQENIAVVCFSQVSNAGARAGEDHGGVIAAKGAGEWGSAATTFLHMTRDAWAIDPAKQGEVTFSMMKSQIGPSGCSLMRYLDFKTSRFRRSWVDQAKEAPWWATD